MSEQMWPQIYCLIQIGAGMMSLGLSNLNWSVFYCKITSNVLYFFTVYSKETYS